MSNPPQRGTAATTPSVAPTAGRPAPGLSLPDHHGVEQSLPAVLASQAALLVFYPFAFSSICGGELRELQDALPDLTKHNVHLLAVSCDPMYSLRVYAEREGFEFPLLSDFWPHGETARAYGIFDEGKGCAVRGSFLVAQDGVVRWSIVNPVSQPRPLTGYHEAIALLDG